MKFKEVIGQKELCGQLQRLAREGRIPHAMLFTGIEGCGTLPLALSLAQMVLSGVAPGEEQSNSAQSADLADRYIHPDLHFTFPVKRRKTSSPTVSDMYIGEWRAQLGKSPYFSFADWMEAMDCEREQPIIYEAESGEILRKLSMKSAMGGNKVLIIAWPERMNDTCSNKLLKLIEEPPARTYIFMVSDNPERLLATILSRTQIVRVPPIDDFSVAVVLAQRFGYEEEQAMSLAHLAQGSLTAAMRLVSADSDDKLHFDLFVLLMRKAYTRDIRSLREWSFQLAEKGREQQKAFLQYAGRFVRENFMYNFKSRELNYLSADEEAFARKFATFINERNVIKLMNELETAEWDIVQNVNPKMVFLDLALQVIILLIRKK